MDAPHSSENLKEKNYRDVKLSEETWKELEGENMSDFIVYINEIFRNKEKLFNCLS